MRELPTASIEGSQWAVCSLSLLLLRTWWSPSGCTQSSVKACRIKSDQVHSMLEHLRIKLAETDAGSLVADRVTLQCYSSCARGLPAAAEEWDLRHLLVEGQPVQRETVVAYLNAISQHLNNEPMIDDQGDNPTRSMKKLAQLLAFADAVGSSKGLLFALDGNVSAKTFYAEATLGERELQLQAVNCHFFRDTSLDLSIMGPSQLTAKKLAKASSSEDKERFRQQLVQQVECLLYLAFKLQLPKLQAAVLTCISCNSCWGGFPAQHSTSNDICCVSTRSERRNSSRLQGST